MFLPVECGCITLWNSPKEVGQIIVYICIVGMHEKWWEVPGSIPKCPAVLKRLSHETFLEVKKLWHESLLEELACEEKIGKEENLQKIISGKENKIRIR